jgi:hypothetical protein
MPTIDGQNHQRAYIDHLYIPRKEGGRGMTQIEGAYIAEVMKLMEYEERKEDPLIKIVRTHQHHTSSTLLETIKNFYKIFSE